MKQTALWHPSISATSLIPLVSASASLLVWLHRFRILPCALLYTVLHIPVYYCMIPCALLPLCTTVYHLAYSCVLLCDTLCTTVYYLACSCILLYTTLHVPVYYCILPCMFLCTTVYYHYLAVPRSAYDDRQPS